MKTQRRMAPGFLASAARGAACGAFVLLLLSGTLVSADEAVTFREGLHMAVLRSRPVKAAGYDEAVARDEAVMARAKMLPDVRASISSTHLANQPAAVFGPLTAPLSNKDFLSWSVVVQQTLYDFRENASRYEASLKEVETRALDTRRIRNLAAVEFALTYLDLLEADEAIRVADKEVLRLESHLRDAQGLYGEGVITRNEVLQAEVRLSDARQRRLAAMNARLVGQAKINSLLQRPLDSEMKVTDEGVGSRELPAMSSHEAWGAALRERPEMQIMDLMWQGLQLRRTAARAAYYPRFFVRGAYDYEENRYQLHENNWSLVLGAGISLYSGGSTGAEVSKIDHQLLKLAEQKDKLADDIMLEVEKYVLNAQDAKGRTSVTKDAAAQAEENLRINRARYEEGVGTATDVLDAISLLTMAETNHNRAVYDSRKAEVAVLYSIGKDLLEVYR